MTAGTAVVLFKPRHYQTIGNIYSESERMNYSPRKIAALLIAISIQLSLQLSLQLSFANYVWAQEDTAVTTIYIVRHADRDGENDALTDVGDQRAQQVADLMKVLRPKAVYSTDTQRTRNTAGPSVAALGLELKIYGRLTDEWINGLKRDHRGESILIVGHSNTSGKIASLLSGNGEFEIDEDEYDRMFVVTLRGDEASAVAIQFGEPTGPNR